MIKTYKNERLSVEAEVDGRMRLLRYARSKAASLPTQPFQLQPMVSQRSDKDRPSEWWRRLTIK